MIEHMVIIKFGPGTTEEQLAECIRRTESLKDIPGVVNLVAGRDISGRNQGHQLGLTVRFTDKSALDNYGPHPTHQAFVAFMEDIGRENIIVVDFDIA